MGLKKEILTRSQVPAVYWNLKGACFDDFTGGFSLTFRGYYSKEAKDSGADPVDKAFSISGPMSEEFYALLYNVAKTLEGSPFAGAEDVLENPSPLAESDTPSQGLITEESEDGR